jgi:hypothetical protein
VSEDEYVGTHPRVKVAHEPDRQFGAIELLFNGRTVDGLRAIKRRVFVWSWMNVVLNGVLVLNVQGLMDHQSDYVRLVHAILLGEFGGLFWRIEVIVAQA